MLTATETARVQKFTADMDTDTAQAMFNLFEMTKPGCDHAANELMLVAHGYAPSVSESTATQYTRHGLVTPAGTIPAPVKSAIRKAVAENYLVIHEPISPALKPELHHE